MAKQDWRTAMTELQEAACLIPRSCKRITAWARFTTPVEHSVRHQGLPGGLAAETGFCRSPLPVGIGPESCRARQGCGHRNWRRRHWPVWPRRNIPRECHRSGARCRKSQIMAITWWAQAFEQGLPEASQALTQLRRLAAVKGNLQTKQSKAAAEAFKNYCDQLWLDFPTSTGTSRTKPSAPPCSSRGRTAEALPVLLREA